MSIRVHKEGRYLKFTKDGNEFSFDIVTGQAYSHHGNPVKTLARYFRGMSLSEAIRSFEDPNYRNWFWHVCRRNRRMSNMGSILKEFKHYLHLESFFCSGFTGHNVPDEPLDRKLIRVLHKFDLGWTHERQRLFETVGVDAFAQIADRGHLGRFTRYMASRTIESLIENGYSITDLIKYIEYLEFVEGVVTPHLLSDIKDYWSEARLVSQNPSRYPKNFLSTKRNTNYRYSMNREKYDESGFELISKKHAPGLYFRRGEYQVIYPTKAEDIRAEGTELNHCVASYVSKVVDGDCHIVFMRRADAPDEALVTVQLSLAYNVIQSRGFGNRSLTDAETEFLEQYQDWATNPKRNFHKQPVDKSSAGSEGIAETMAVA